MVANRTLGGCFKGPKGRCRHLRDAPPDDTTGLGYHCAAHPRGIPSDVLMGGVDCVPEGGGHVWYEPPTTDKRLDARVAALLTVDAIPRPCERICLRYRPADPSARPKRVAVAVPDGTVTVEEFALRHFASEGYYGFHGQNDSWIVLTQLCFLDQLLYLPNSCRSSGDFALAAPPIQIAEDSHDDYISLLAQLRDEPQLETLLLERAERYMDLPLYFTEQRETRDSVRFGTYLEWVQILCRAIDRSVLLRIVDWMMRHPSGNVRGLPDLHLVKDGVLLLAEVKSPRDRISPYQTEALELLSGLGVPTCIVECVEDA